MARCFPGDRAGRALNSATIVLIYVVVAAVLIVRGQLPLFAAIIALALPQAVRANLRAESTAACRAAAGFIGWPLWYHCVCLEHNRLFGWVYILGLAANALWYVFGS